MIRVLTLVATAAVLSTTLVACGSDDTEPAAASTPSAAASTSAKPTSKATPTPSADSSTVVLTIAVTGKSVTPAPSRTKVPVDAKVRLTVTSDVPNEIHVHGYEIYKDVAPGKPAVITFTADQPGLFEIETHESPVLVLGQLQVQ